MKTCIKCNRKLPANKDYFYSSASAKDKLNSSCKECQKEYFKEYHAKQKAEREKLKPKIKEGYKICINCNKELKATNRYFHRNSKKKDGLSSECKKCKNSYNAAWKEKAKQGLIESGVRQMSERALAEYKEKEKRDKKAFETLIKQAPPEAILIEKLSTKDNRNGKHYKILKRVDKKNNAKTKHYFEGKLIQETLRHITLENTKTNVRESFLKVDFLTGEYKLKEVI